MSAVAVFVGLTIAACVGNDPDLREAASANEPDAGETPAASGEDGGVPELAPDAAPPVGCPTECLPPAPPGWVGPSAVAYGAAGTTEPASCPSPYTERKVEAQHGLETPPATCDCGAPVVAGARCKGFIKYPASMERAGQLVCVPDQGTRVPFVTTDDCITPPPGSKMVVVEGLSLARGSCTFPAAVAKVPPVTFKGRAVACGLPQITSCSGRADCVAAPASGAPFGRLCIHRDGDQSCPSHDYAKKLIAYRSVKDDRACAACTATARGGACGTELGITTRNHLCMAGPHNERVRANGSCVALPTGYIAPASLAPTGIECVPPTTGLTGTAQAAEPVTFCCNG